MTIEVTQLLAALVADIVRNPTTAFQFARDGEGVIAAQGISEYDLSGIDMRQVVDQACSTYDLPAEARSALQSYTSGGGGSGGYPAPPPGPTHNMADVVQHMTYVTYETHQGDTTITQTILDQSTDIEVHGDNNAPIDVHNASASAEGAIAQSGDGEVNSASGAGSQVIDDSQVGQNQVGSPGAVQANGSIDAPVVTGTNTGVIFDDGSINAPVNTGSFDGIQNSGSVSDVVQQGDNSQAVNADSITAPFSFGGGAITNVQGSSFNESSFGGDNTVVKDNDLSQGGALGTGSGPVTGNFTDNSDHSVTNDNDITTTATTTTNNSINDQVNIDATDSNVITETGEGDQTFQELAEEEPEPKELTETDA